MKNFRKPFAPFMPLCLVTLTTCALLVSCSSIDVGSGLSLRAMKIAEESLIVDTHIDVPYRVYRNPEVDVTQATEGGDFDLPRARKGHLNGAFMSIYIPAGVDQEGRAGDLANELIDLVEGIVARAPSDFAIATCSQDLIHQKRQGLISLPMGMENGGPIGDDLASVKHFRERGIRYVTLTHGRSNKISDSSYDTNQRWKGLSPYGKELVPELNSQGIMIDISHLSDKAAWQVLELSTTPVIASHSSLRHFIPGFHRNMTDEMVKALADNGGVIQINFGSGFILEESRIWSSQRSAAEAWFRREQGNNMDPEALQAFRKQWRTENPYPFADTDDVLDHIDRVVELAGIDYVGIGSDYDGVGDTLPDGLKDASTFPNLIQGLLDRGYSKTDIRKILGDNLMRVWRANEAFAESSGYPTLCTSDLSRAEA